MNAETIKATLPRDLMASVVVFLVALPLCMGIAIASGLPPAKGVITGIVGGLVVGWLAGAPLQVSGPAAASRCWSSNWYSNMAPRCSARSCCWPARCSCWPGG